MGKLLKKDPKNHFNILQPQGPTFVWCMFSSKVFRRKEDAKEGKPKDTTKTLTSYERKQNPIGRQKPKGRLEGDQVMYLHGWITIPTKTKYEAK